MRVGSTVGWAILLGVAAIGLMGCMTTHKASVSPFELGQHEMVVRPAPRTGYYEVKCAETQSSAQRTVASSGRVVQKGQPLGFCLNPDGDVLAVAGDETFTMAFAPPEATRFVWSHRSKEKTQFGKEMDKLADAGATAAKMALVAGLYVGAIALEAQCDDGVHGHHGERHHRHKEGRHDGRDPKSPENQKDK